MNKYIIVLIFALFSFSVITSVSAIYPNEVINYTPQDIGLINFTNYSSDFSFNQVNFTNESFNALVPSDTIVQNITITFEGYINQNDIVPKVISGGGGSCLTNWTCSDWSDCIDGNQTRTCTKVKSYCYAKPVNLTRICDVQPSDNTSNPPIENNTQSNPITEKPSIKNDIIWLIVIVLIAIGVLWLIFKNKDKGGSNNEIK